VINQGDIYWIYLEEPVGSSPGYAHPSGYSNNLFIASSPSYRHRMQPDLNLKRGTAPGNVLLEAGRGNLPKQSVVGVSQVFTVDKGQLETSLAPCQNPAYSRSWTALDCSWSHVRFSSPRSGPPHIPEGVQASTP